VVGTDAPGRLDAVDTWHAQVHQHDVRAVLLGAGDGLLPVRGGADVDVGHGLQQRDHALPDTV